MISKYRQKYNSEFSQEKYAEIKEMLKEKSGTEPLFRISESPIFLSESFRQKLQDASESIINQIENFSLEELSKAIPEKISVPNDTEKPHFLAIDFGICKNDSGEIVPQLIELQAFPTPVSYTHLDVYKRQLGKSGDGDSFFGRDFRNAISS